MTETPAPAHGSMRLRRAIGALLLLLAAPAVYLASRVVIDNRLERWVARDDAEERRYEAFRESFGSDEFVVVAYSGRPLFESGSLGIALDALERLESVPGVLRVQGIPQVYRDVFGGADPEELEREMTSTPFYKGLFLSEDAGSAALLATVSPEDGPAARRRLVRDLRAAARPLSEAGFRVALVGSTVLIAALDATSEREATITFPIAVLGSLLVLAALLRSARAMLAAAISAGASVAVSLGLFVAAGGALNMLTAALPALLWVLGLSYAVHVISRYRHLRASSGEEEALRGALGRTRTGVFYSALTTVLGFLSLLAAGLPPVRELGIFGAVGIAIAFLVSQTVVPLLVGTFRVKAAAEHHRAPAWARKGLEIPLRWPRTVVAASAALFLVAVSSIPWIHLESDPLSFLPEDDPVVRDYRWVGTRLAGFYTADVVLRLPVPWTDPAVWPVIDGFAGSLSASPIVAKVVSPLDLLRKLHQWDGDLGPAAYRLPAAREPAEALLDQLDSRGREALASLAGPSGREVRLSAIVREMEEGRFLALVREAEERIASLPAGWSGSVTGQVLRLARSQQNLIASQLRSLVLAFALVFLAVWVGLRSYRLTLVAIPPNLLPIAVTFALMAWLRIPLDAATVMVASVALGIAVDNSLHYLIEVSRERETGAAAVDAARGALVLVAPTVAAATLAAFTGFLSLTVSSFLPIRYYGGLSASLLAAALVADLWLTPAILVVAGGARRAAGESGEANR